MSNIKPTLNSADIELLGKKFATKADLNNLLTKDDAKKFATKDDLNGLASKTDIQKLDKKFDKLFDFIDKDIAYMKKRAAYHLGIEASSLSRTTS